MQASAARLRVMIGLRIVISPHGRPSGTTLLQT
jgi:hypothetical protein